MDTDQRPSESALLLAMSEAVTPAEYRLGRDPCTIGRSADCVILVPGAQISRLHATIAPRGPRYVLSDAGSVNGTYVNGRRISGEHMLTDDDTIGLGLPAPLLRFLDPEATKQHAGRLRYDERSLAFWLNGQELDLSKGQLRLLTFLYQHVGAVCSREECAQALWGHDYEPGLDAGALDQAFNNLRRILREADPEADLIQTRRGRGYELVL